ncbi:hypothetical protein [Nocardia sp. NPDC051832]|uniref:hypothetical protein n=1 Tax=Nocardia sp. NPDC051832 TaxID=3155673 RepID=UPI00342BF634
MKSAPAQQDTATAPGRATLAGTFVAVVVLLFAHLGTAPGVGDLTGPDQLLGLVAGGLVLSISLSVWAIKTLYLVGRERRWSWQIASAPAVVFTGLVAGLIPW